MVEEEEDEEDEEDEEKEQKEQEKEQDEEDEDMGMDIDVDKESVKDTTIHPDAAPVKMVVLDGIVMGPTVSFCLQLNFFAVDIYIIN